MSSRRREAGAHPRVSVIMPVRNAVATVGEAIDSCLGQTFADWELLVVDDGSGDGSREVIEERARRDSRIRVLETDAEQRGVVPAHRVGMERGMGALIARMDADDVSLAERFARQAEFLARRPEVSVCGCGVKIRRRTPVEKGVGGGVQVEEVMDGYREYESWLNSLRDPEQIAAQRFIESPVAHATAMMRRCDVERVGGYRETVWAEDYDLWLRLLEGGCRMANLESPLVEWWDSPGRMTRIDERYSQRRFLEAKAHYLSRMQRVKRDGVHICGAGPIGKRLGAYLRASEVEVHGFIEVHPRRIGESIGGVTVRGVEDTPEAGGTVLLGAVGMKGARERIRALAKERGYREGEDLFCVA